MTRTLVLDFGGVISKTLFDTHALSEAALGLAPWPAMQAGDMAERDCRALRMAGTGALAGETWTDFPQFIARVRGADPAAVIWPEAPDAIGWARSEGHCLAVLSKELDLFHGKDFRAKLPFLADFDLIVDATHTGILKPDPRAFGFITEGPGLPASHCVFVDDQKKNLKGAEAVGMPFVHFDVTRPDEGRAKALGMLQGDKVLI